jgi:hypothetical protein
MRGPLGVYHLVQEHLNPGMIIDAIKDAAISYVMEAIITRVAARIIMMLNPAGAILQAIEAIYRVIKWVIDNAARIFSLIEAVVNGAAQILAGNVSGVANLVERALGLLIIPVIDFLADYLGLGGIPAAIKKVIMGLQSKVEQILDKVIGFVVDKAKALWAAMKGKKGGKDKDGKDGDKKDDDPRTMEQKQAAVTAAAQEATTLLDQTDATEASVRKKLPPIKDKYKLVKLDLVVDAKDASKERVHVHAEINPTAEGPQREISDGDELVGEFKIDRPAFSRKTKRGFANNFPSAHEDDTTRILEGLDRRHIISSDEMAKRYEQKLAPMKISEAAALLNGKGATVSDPATREKVIKAATKRHKAFFNELENLWPGDSSENRSIGSDRDQPGAGEPHVPAMSDAEMQAHEKKIDADYGLD